MSGSTHSRFITDGDQFVNKAICQISQAGKRHGISSEMASVAIGQNAGIFGRFGEIVSKPHSFV